MVELKNYLVVGEKIYNLSMADIVKISKVLNLNATPTNTVKETPAPKSTPKKDQKSVNTTRIDKYNNEDIVIQVVGGLERIGNYVYTAKDSNLSSKARFAINCNAERFGGKKTPKNSGEYNFCKPFSDKWLQCWVFKTYGDAVSFMEDQARSLSEYRNK